VALVEVDCGWIPYIREQMDDRHSRSKLRHDTPPSAYLDHNFNYVFITDSYGVRNRHEVGIERMMWSSDFPHGGSDWPHSREAIERQFKGVPDDERYPILAGNALRLYGKAA
jgi:predicted TIM-barrel fold metal-dependent hydrolase